MCGILCCFKLSHSTKRNILDSFDAKLQQLLKNRGPDEFGQIILDSEEILFAGFVLWHQGEKLASQPMLIDNGILIFNGDIFNIHPNISIADSTWLLSELKECKDDNDLLQVFKDIEGPFSFIYYNKVKKVLYFGRDSLGRNSFLIENDTAVITLSSLSHIMPSSTKKTIELPSIGIFKIDINTKALTLYPWRNLKEEHCNALRQVENILHKNITISKSIDPKWLTPLETSNTKANYDFYEIINEIGETDNLYEELLKNKLISSTVNQLLYLLEESIKNRVQKTRKYCSDCLKQIKNKLEFKNVMCTHAKIGILFSGGIDCSILAALSHKFVDSCDPIDLINVAFENIKNQQNNQNINWKVPDRISANETFEELKNLYPERVWNLIEINVNRSEVYEKLRTHISDLIYPLNTVLDESIGCAFWFAARGIGTVDKIDYESKSRVILIGSGADELFGGYTRHRNAFRRCKGSHSDKLKSLGNELDMDWNRIPYRNLGRDDRVIADHGKTVRAPFIEENIVHFVRNLTPSQKCCFALNQGIGDKLILRLCGFKLGLKNCAMLKKKAIQFGSKIADKRRNAADISEILLHSKDL